MKNETELLQRVGLLESTLKEITDHFAKVMAGPLVTYGNIQFENGVEGIPTIAKARAVLADGRPTGVGPD